ncbi:GNAT family N-acetyltransferase, partial [Actinoplanes solisilvae]|uniref:GNAT family N-acetyltransferase n=1 Tax=Actinoplanes solisilvae TaxID=2486853 RepID=UPI000FD6FE62
MNFSGLPASLHSVSTINDLEWQLAANRRYWTSWNGELPDNDLTVYRTGIHHNLLNGVLRVRNRPLKDAIDEAHEQLDGSRWGWWVGADSDEATVDGLLAHGATITGEMPVMAIDILGATRFDPPDDLRIRIVRERSEMREYVAAYSGPLGFRAEDLEVIVDRELANRVGRVVRLAGIIDGRTVGTCTLSVATETAALYFIATDPAYRRRGVAT